MATPVRISVFVMFVASAAVAGALLFLRPSATWSDPVQEQPSTAVVVPLTCDSPWERLTESPASLARSAERAAFPGDPCGLVTTTRQNLASAAVVLAGALAVSVVLSLLPRRPAVDRRRRIARRRELLRP